VCNVNGGELESLSFSRITFNGAIQDICCKAYLRTYSIKQNCSVYWRSAAYKKGPFKPFA